MTGREKFEAAFSADGTPEFPVAQCYHGIFLRDHWEQVTDHPWWALYEPDPVKAAGPWIDLYDKTGEDWFRFSWGTPHQQRDAVIESTPQGVFRVREATGVRQELRRPPIGGEQYCVGGPAPAHDVTDADELDAVLDGMGFAPDRTAAMCDPEDGRHELPRILLERFGAEKYALVHVGSPYWPCHALWGFEGMMVGLVDFPELIERATRRLLEDAIGQVSAFSAAGADCVWIEECMTDMVSPEQYARFCLPHLRELTDAIRGAGLRSTHYFCGNPHGKWDLLLDTGADALALEESKKGFEIDIAAVADRVAGRMTLFGNLDSIHLLEKGTDQELRHEVSRQLDAGRRNGSRFVMSVGSPVTPNTPLARVRRYCDVVRELGGRA